MSRLSRTELQDPVLSYLENRAKNLRAAIGSLHEIREEYLEQGADEGLFTQRIDNAVSTLLFHSEGVAHDMELHKAERRKQQDRLAGPQHE